MFTQVDTRCGLVKVYWKDVSKRVHKVDPTFAKIVDDYDPDNNFPIYLAYLPYGDLKGDTISTFLPKVNGGYFRVSDPGVDKDITKNLGYSYNGSPFGMVLEKKFEYFIDLKHERTTIPWAIYNPGKFFSFSNYLGQKSSRMYSPNSLLIATSGARSAFLLPNVGCLTNHSNLQKEFNVQRSPPKSLYEHWYIFKEIINSNVIECDWRSCIIYFSENWLDKLHNDESWLKLKLYLHEQAWKYFEFERSRTYYDIAFSSIQKQKNLKPNPYLTDTARHLFAIALGDALGFAPAINEDMIPSTTIQKAYVEAYGLKKYLPTIMNPTKMLYEVENSPVYYSLQNPSTFNFSPKARKIFSTLFELRELQHIVKTFIKELKKDTVMCADTVLGEVARNIEFSYFHNKVDLHNIIQPSTVMPSYDPLLCRSKHNIKSSDAIFASDASFVRGCVSIKSKL